MTCVMVLYEVPDSGIGKNPRGVGLMEVNTNSVLSLKSRNIIIITQQAR